MHGEIPIECTTCAKRFSSHQGLLKHSVVHSDDSLLQQQLISKAQKPTSAEYFGIGQQWDVVNFNLVKYIIRAYGFIKFFYDAIRIQGISRMMRRLTVLPFVHNYV